MNAFKINPLSAVSRRIVWVCLTILWDWQLYGSDENKINNSEHFVDTKQEMLSLEGPLKIFYELIESF